MKNKLIGALVGAFFILQSSISVFAAGVDSINVPDGYINSTDKISVSTDESKEVVSIRVKIDHGSYKDITDSKQFSVDENCTAYVKIKYINEDGEAEIKELSKEIKNFDGVAPKVNAYIKGEDLIIQVNDEISGAKVLNVDGIDYTDLNNGSIAINLKDLENSKEYFTIYAIDNAGNKTKTLRVNNPYYVGEDPQSNVDRGVDNPQSVEKTKPTSATAIISSHTDEDGEDISSVSYREWKDGSTDTTGNGSKQFFTIKTKSDKTFYIVVDESYNQQTAYLLTEASENDLLNFVNYDGNAVDNGETTVYTLPKEEKQVEAIDEVEVEVLNETKGSSVSALATIILLGLIGGGAYAYKAKKKSDEDEEDEVEDIYEEEQEDEK